MRRTLSWISISSQLLAYAPPLGSRHRPSLSVTFLLLCLADRFQGLAASARVGFAPCADKASVSSSAAAAAFALPTLPPCFDRSSSCLLQHNQKRNMTWWPPFRPRQPPPDPLPPLLPPEAPPANAAPYLKRVLAESRAVLDADLSSFELVEERRGGGSNCGTAGYSVFRRPVCGGKGVSECLPSRGDSSCACGQLALSRADRLLPPYSAA